MLVKAYGDRRRLCSQGTCLIVGDQHSASSVQCFQFRIVSKAETMKLLPLNYATNNAVFSDLENGTNVGDILPFPWDQQSPEQRTNKAPRKRLVIIARSVLRSISKLSQLQSIQCRPERWITLVPRECIYLSHQRCFFPRYDALWQITLPMGVDEQAPDGNNTLLNLIRPKRFYARFDSRLRFSVFISLNCPSLVFSGIVIFPVR